MSFESANLPRLDTKCVIAHVEIRQVKIAHLKTTIKEKYLSPYRTRIVYYAGNDRVVFKEQHFRRAVKRKHLDLAELRHIFEIAIASVNLAEITEEKRIIANHDIGNHSKHKSKFLFCVT